MLGTPVSLKKVGALNFMRGRPQKRKDARKGGARKINNYLMKPNREQFDYVMARPLSRRLEKEVHDRKKKERFCARCGGDLRETTGIKLRIRDQLTSKSRRGGLKEKRQMMRWERGRELVICTEKRTDDACVQICEKKRESRTKGERDGREKSWMANGGKKSEDH